MALETPPFTHAPQTVSITYGRGCIKELDEALAEHDLSNVLVVTGRNVGANEAVMEPIREGIGDRLAGVFDRTTPAKEIETAYDGVGRIHETDADALVAVGAGSSLDTATVMSALNGEHRPLSEVLETYYEADTIPVPDATTLLPTFKVPTTFAGADMSVAAGTTLPPEDGSEREEHVFVDNKLMPTGLFYDPDLFETTPADVLSGSAINGLDKAIEKAYSAYANPLTDATAIRGLQYLRESLPDLRTSDDPAVMDRAVVGIILAQDGVSVPDAYKINLVHAFGHALRNTFGIQQGVAHAIVLPHVLRFMFDRVDGRRKILAEGLGASEADDTATAIVEAVTEIRDGLELPARLRDVDGPSKDKLRHAAELTHDDPFFSAGPPAFDPSVDAVEEVLREAW